MPVPKPRQGRAWTTPAVLTVITVSCVLRGLKTHHCDGTEKMSVRHAIQRVLQSFGYRLNRIRPKIYDQDGLITEHGHDFMADPRFCEAYNHAFNATKKDPSHHGPWRVHIATWAASTALRRDGDFIECGTARAFVTTAILKYTDWNSVSGDRRFYLVDTFEGIVEDLQTDAERAMGAIARHGERYKNNYPDALRNVSPFRNVHLIKGMVPNILVDVPSKRVAYLHLDMNSAVAEVAALEHFWPRMVLGGVVLLDDYAYAGYEPQRHRLNTLAKKLGIEIASLPTGQGLIVK
jgi:hypothetical protein